MLPVELQSISKLVIEFLLI